MTNLNDINNLENLNNIEAVLSENVLLPNKYPLGLMTNHPQKMVMQDNFDEPLDDLFDYNQDVKIINGKTK